MFSIIICCFLNQCVTDYRQVEPPLIVLKVVNALEDDQMICCIVCRGFCLLSLKQSAVSTVRSMKLSVAFKLDESKICT